MSLALVSGFANNISVAHNFQYRNKFVSRTPIEIMCENISWVKKEFKEANRKKKWEADRSEEVRMTKNMKEKKIKNRRKKWHPDVATAMKASFATKNLIHSS